MSKGELLIRLISDEVLIEPSLLMEDENFITEIKKLINKKIQFNHIKNNMVEWCNNNY
tara:strand:- start:1170 stop:1343 length:174 start_codon:yes stop_codon:yes gene_type:complete